MKKIIKSIEPVVIAASGVDEQAVSQASLSTEKNMQQLLGESNETEDSVGRDCGEHPHNECGDRGRARECN